MKTHLILNGKKASLISVRDAISKTRNNGLELEIRVTYEGGDVERLVKEAIREGVKKLVIGGGDGSTNEMVNALMKYPKNKRPILAILPLGTANDFATSCGISQDSYEALSLVNTGEIQAIDVAKANDRYFLNIATAGFGAEVTATTPVELKNFLGGGAYTLTGVLRAIGFEPYQVAMKTENESGFGDVLIGAVCNGRQAGGGQVLAPDAYLNDGYLDILILKKIGATELLDAIAEVENPSRDTKYIRRFKTKWLEIESQNNIIPVNLDGEPYKSKNIRFEVLQQEIKIVLPDRCKLLK